MTIPALPQYQLLINGVPLTGYQEDSSWSISQNFGRQGDTASFSLYDEHDDGVQNFFVPPLATVELTDISIGEILFGGLVSTPELERLSPNLNRWNLSCRDYTYFPDNVIVAAQYLAMTADDIILDLVNHQSASGIIAQPTSMGGFISPGPVIPAVQINYITLSQALNLIGQLASTTTSYAWYIDEGLNLHWFDELQVPAPTITFTDAAVNPSSIIGGYLSSNKYQWDGTSIRTSAIVQGATYNGQQIDNFTGDGTTTSWQLTFPADTTQISSAILTVGGTSQTVGQNQPGNPPTTDFVFTQDPMTGIWYLQTGVAPTPAFGVAIVLQYVYVAPVVTRYDDYSSQARFAHLANKGIFQEYISDSSILTISSAQLRAIRETQEYALPQERTVFTTPEVWPGHIRAGNAFDFVSSTISDSARGFAPGLNGTFIVIKETISGKLVGYREYGITGVRIA